MSSSESDDDDWVMYCDREEWSDVTPIPQDDGDAPVVAIAYSAKFRDVYDYMRAMWKKNEMSERAFSLTEDAIKLNPANYTVWHYRRVLLKALAKDLRNELEYISAIIRREPKNYQVWYHRGIVVKDLNDPSAELAFTAEILRIDHKNYHCWQHRQLVLNHFKLWGTELGYTTELLTDDIRNNSAWNQRFYTLVNTTGFDKDTIDTEVKFAVDAIKIVPNNESAWNYLNGVLTKAGGIHLFPELRDNFEHMLGNGIDSPYLLSFLVDHYTKSLEVEELETEAKEQALTRILYLLDQLATEVDFIRKEYWGYLKRTIQQKYL